MKKFAVGSVFIKLILLYTFFAFTFSSCQSAQLAESEISPTPTATPQNANDNINRPTSEPYKGDLSIFEGDKRAENLQIERVMDILKISEGKTVADHRRRFGLVHGSSGETRRKNGKSLCRRDQRRCDQIHQRAQTEGKSAEHRNHSRCGR